MTFNEWFLSLPEGRQKVLRDDKWMLASAAFDAALLISKVERDATEAKLAKAVEALEYIMDGYGLDAPDYKQTEYDDDDEPIQDDWIVNRIRATLAEIDKGDTQ